MLCCILGVGALAFGLGVLLSCFMPSEVLVVILAILIAAVGVAYFIRKYEVSLMKFIVIRPPRFLLPLFRKMSGNQKKK